MYKISVNIVRELNSDLYSYLTCSTNFHIEFDQRRVTYYYTIPIIAAAL